jgi:hypothetical protein
MKSKPLTKYESLHYLLGQYGDDKMTREEFWRQMNARGYTQACIDEWCQQYHELEAKREIDNEERRQRKEAEGRAARAATSGYARGSRYEEQDVDRQGREDDWRRDTQQGESQGQERGRQDQGAGEGQGGAVQGEAWSQRTLTTDEDRAFARKHARLIYLNHLEKGRGLSNHISTDISYEEQLRRGLLAELIFGREFGLAINVDVLDDGDGGFDFKLPLTASTGLRIFSINIKAKAVQLSWDGLRRSGTHLRVPVRECEPETIYVFAIYHERQDTAEVLRWTWGSVLMRRNERAIYENSDGTENYIIPFEELRELQELKDRMP